MKMYDPKGIMYDTRSNQIPGRLNEIQPTRFRSQGGIPFTSDAPECASRTHFFALPRNVDVKYSIPVGALRVPISLASP